MSSLSLFDLPPVFGGETYEPEHDQERLCGQLERVKVYMLNHGWVTLKTLAKAVQGSENGVSARLRDLRKAEFGSYTVERRRVSGGLYEYRVRA